MSYWQGPARWINLVLLGVLGVILVDGLLRLLGASADNLLVGGVRTVADVLLFPVAGVFAGQPHGVTMLFGVLGIKTPSVLN
jgi:hypothetical protein